MKTAIHRVSSNGSFQQLQRANWPFFLMSAVLVVLCSLVPHGLVVAGDGQGESGLSFWDLAGSALLIAQAFYIAVLIRRLHASRSKSSPVVKDPDGSASADGRQATKCLPANMAHDLRSPLNAILGFSEELQSDARISAEQQEKAAIIHRNGERLLVLIDKALGMPARGDPSALSPENSMTAHLQDAAPPEGHANGLSLRKVEGLEPGQPKWRILVADDSPENLMLLGGLFSRVGFAVIEATNGVLAVERFRRERPHLVWMDLNMPELDGYAATAQIRVLPGGDVVKILAFTADPTDAERRRALQAGCDAVFCKPLRAGELFQAMKQQLGVRYTYQVSDAVLSSSRQAALDLPRDLRRALADAARQLDVAASEQVLKALAVHHSEAAERLRPLVQTFQFGRILELLDD